MANWVKLKQTKINKNTKLSSLAQVHYAHKETTPNIQISVLRPSRFQERRRNAWLAGIGGWLQLQLVVAIGCKKI